MAGMRVVVVACDDRRQRRPRRPAREGRRSTPTRLAAIMVTYPSTHGVLRGRASPTSARSCTRPAARSTSTAPTSTRWSASPSPGEFGADVSHLNLHKTFCIPHGGGGPGVGPVGGARAPRAVPAEPPAASGGRAGDGHRADLGGAVGLGRHPADLVGLHADDGRRRAAPRPPRSRSSNANYVAARLRRALPGALHRPRAGWSPTSASSTCARSPRRPASPSTTSPSGSSTTASTPRRCRSRSPAR